MMSTTPPHTTFPDSLASESTAFRRSAQGQQPAVLSDIYKDDTNIAIWQRKLSAPLQDAVKSYLASNATVETKMVVTQENVLSAINDAFQTSEMAELSDDIALLVDMFCCLFGLARVGLRMQVLDQAMCPKFHVDRVPCRLVTTYQGVATEWLPHETVDHTKLGQGSHGQTDDRSGLYQQKQAIHQLNCGDVALLKGTLWQGNENAGLVHRSPVLPGADKRLLLTLDFIH
ncbi:DUF1826 domain-containing protein [Endozoicomonas sp.]|uniref:DUF1826 domain-containing protein n=1 Tax=Endozoicomonas sp. TaxID=1892382 RepID=UPI003AF5DF4F